MDCHEQLWIHNPDFLHPSHLGDIWHDQKKCQTIVRLNSLVLYAIYFGIILSILKRSTRPLWFSLAIILASTLLYLVFPSKESVKAPLAPTKHELQNIQNERDEYCTPETGFCKVTPRQWNVMNYNQNTGPFSVEPMNDMDAFYYDRTFYTLPVNTIPDDREASLKYIYESSLTNTKEGSIYRHFPACVASQMVKNDVYARGNDHLYSQGSGVLVGN